MIVVHHTTEFTEFSRRFMDGVNAEYEQLGERPTMCILPHNDWMALKGFASLFCTYPAAYTNAEFMGIKCYCSYSATEMVFGSNPINT